MFPIHHQLFARVSVDDSTEANMSMFAAEMQETAFILRSVDKRSMLDHPRLEVQEICDDILTQFQRNN